MIYFKSLIARQNVGFQSLGSAVSTDTVSLEVLQLETSDLYQWVVKANKTDLDANAISAGTGTIINNQVTATFSLTAADYTVGSTYFFALREINANSSSQEVIQVSFTISQNAVLGQGTTTNNVSPLFLGNFTTTERNALVLTKAVLIFNTTTSQIEQYNPSTSAWSALGGGGGAVDSVNGQTGVVVLDKTDIGLGNVDNTTDLLKPISTATQVALDAKRFKDALIVGSSDADYITDGTDDDVQIQQAINDSNTNGGGIVIVKAGDYQIAATVQMADDVMLVGQNQSHYGNVTQFIASAAIDMFRFSTTQPGGMVDIKIDGNNKQATSGIVFEKNALAKIKGAVLRNVFVEQCQTGVDSRSTGITSGPFDDVSWYNLRLANCTVGLDHWSVTTNIFGGVIGGCDTGVYCRNASGLKTYGIVFTGNDTDFELDNQTPFSYSINDSYFEGTSVAHVKRTGTTPATMGSLIFKGCTFLNSIDTGNAFDFTYASGRAVYQNCRFDTSGANSAQIATNVGTTVSVASPLTSVIPTIIGLGSLIVNGDNISGVGTIDCAGTITSGAMNANGAGLFIRSGVTNILSILRQVFPVNASTVVTSLGDLAFKTGTSSVLINAQSTFDMVLATDGTLTLLDQQIKGVAAPTVATDVATKAYVDNPSDWRPIDYGFVSWSFDLANIASQLAPAAGQAQVIKLKVPQGGSITNIILGVGTAGATLTAGRNFAAIYQDNALLGVTSDQSSEWNSIGLKVMPIDGGPITVNAGTVDILFWATGTTRPGFVRGTSTSNVILAGGLTGTDLRFATANTGLTTTAPATIGTKTVITIAYWAAIS